MTANADLMMAIVDFEMLAGAGYDSNRGNFNKIPAPEVDLMLADWLYFGEELSNTISSGWIYW